MHAGAQQRGEIVRANGKRQIAPASGVLEETRGPRRKGTKEELAPPIEQNGNSIDWDKAGWKQYWKRCDWLTRKIRKQMLENWNGYDYISGDYIKDNLNLHYSHGDYPTLDHIKPRSQCFREGLSPYEATKPENLAWTTRKNNSKKSQKKLK